MATREGFEPPTFGFGDQRSARLNYRAIGKLVSLERFELSPPGPKPGTLPGYAIESWCILRGSNSRQPRCKHGTLPTELTMPIF